MDDGPVSALGDWASRLRQQLAPAAESGEGAQAEAPAQPAPADPWRPLALGPARGWWRDRGDGTGYALAAGIAAWDGPWPPPAAPGPGGRPPGGDADWPAAAALLAALQARGLAAPAPGADPAWRPLEPRRWLWGPLDPAGRRGVLLVAGVFPAGGTLPGAPPPDGGALPDAVRAVADPLAALGAGHPPPPPRPMPDAAALDALAADLAAWAAAAGATGPGPTPAAYAALAAWGPPPADLALQLEAAWARDGRPAWAAAWRAWRQVLGR